MKLSQPWEAEGVSHKVFLETPILGPFCLGAGHMCIVLSLRLNTSALVLALVKGPFVSP